MAASQPIIDNVQSSIVGKQENSIWKCTACLNHNDSLKLKCVCCEQSRVVTKGTTSNNTIPTEPQFTDEPETTFLFGSSSAKGKNAPSPSFLFDNFALRSNAKNDSGSVKPANEKANKSTRKSSSSGQFSCEILAATAKTKFESTLHSAVAQTKQPTFGSSALNGVENSNIKLFPVKSDDLKKLIAQVDFDLPSDLLTVQSDIRNYKKIRSNMYTGSIKPALKLADPCSCNTGDRCGDQCLNRLLYTECSKGNCPCGNECQNMTIQKNKVAPLARIETQNKGIGIKAKEFIANGTYIMEYLGEIVNEKDYEERTKTCRKGDDHFYGVNLENGLYIDARRFGNESRFINHSCNPNCEMQKWCVNGISRIALFAIKDIRAGEEISYDYNFFPYKAKQKCKCGEDNCRGFIIKSTHKRSAFPAKEKPTTLKRKTFQIKLPALKRNKRHK